MKHLWALPVALRVVIAAQRPFSVHTDLLAYPQYEVSFPDSFIYPEDANRYLDPTTREPVETDNLEYRRMILHDTPYLCAIPNVAEDSAANQTSSSAGTQTDEQQELVRASDHGSELLLGLQGRCIYYSAGWWIYSFCYNDAINQFHALAPNPSRGVPVYPPTPDPNVPNFLLGRYKQPSKQQNSELGPQSSPSTGSPNNAESSGSRATSNAQSTELQTRGSTNILVQKLGGGTMCDLTGRDRRIEVQFHCNPSAPDHISTVKETASCVYLMVVQTPRLCGDMAFMPQQGDIPQQIVCREIVSKEGELEWMQRMREKAQREIFGAQQQQPLQAAGEKAAEELADLAEPSNTPNLVIGGIELGGQRIVGSTPELTIKVSRIAQPNKPPSRPPGDRHITTLAKFDGRYRTVLSEREYQRHGLRGNPDEMEAIIAEIEAKAFEEKDGQPWQLDVVDTPHGTQFLLKTGEGSEMRYWFFEVEEDADGEEEWKEGRPDDAGSAEGYRANP